MSFVLPGNQRQLRFSGEAKAFTPKEDPGAAGNVALGKPRVRRNTAPPTPVPPPPSEQPVLTQPSARAQRNTGGMPASGPSSLPPTNRGGGSYTPPPVQSFREHESFEDDYDDGEDQQATMAIDRDREGIDLLPRHTPIPRQTSRPSAPPMAPMAMAQMAPIPGFRPAAQMNVSAARATVLVAGAQPAPKKGAPLALWLCAAVLAGVLSYFVTPMAMSHFESAPAKATADAR